MLLKSHTLTIGRLAKKAGVHIETIRHYQRIGLIDEPKKPETGYRQYSLEIVERIHFIKRAQQLSFSLSEIRELLKLGKGRCDDVRMYAEKNRHKIKQQIKDLQAMEKVLSQWIDRCHTNDVDQKCPMIETLALPSQNER